MTSGTSGKQLLTYHAMESNNSLLVVYLQVMFHIYEDAELKPLLDAVNVEREKEKEKENES